MTETKFFRPPLDEALANWKKCLAAQGLPEELLWIFSENLCLEPLQAAPGSFHHGFQTRFTPPHEDDLGIAYDHFCETDQRLVFYRLGSAGNKSVCILLCDQWFEGRNLRDGFIRNDKWGISFRPGHAGEIEEITELTRWVRRVKHDRALHDFDFAMSLEAINEIIAHGRVLQPYERFAQRMLNRLRRMLDQ